MFCEKCGTKMEAGANFCGNCGDVVEQPRVSTGKTKNKLIGMITCGVVALVLVIGLIALFSGRGPEAVLRRYIDALGTFDMQALSRHSAFDVDGTINLVLDANNITQREFNDMLYEMHGVRNMRDLHREIANEVTEQLREEFGRNYRISFDIIESFELSQREITQQIEQAERSISRRLFGIALSDVVQLDNINEMIEYTVDLTISGSLGQETNSITIMMVRIGRQWLVWDYSILFDLPI